MTVRRLLLALDFLHAEAEVIHIDLKTDNLMLSLEDTSVLVDFVTAESENPSPGKLIGQSHIIYSSRKFRRPTEAKHYSLPILCDFGEARIGKTQESGPFVQPHIYRVPEVIFEMPWGSAIDIWNLAGLIWDLFEGQHLFGDIFDARGGHDPFRYLALMVALIGPPPPEFVRRSETMGQCFDSSGGWIAHHEAPVPSVSLEALEKRLGGEEKELFLAFVRPNSFLNIRSCSSSRLSQMGTSRINYILRTGDKKFIQGLRHYRRDLFLPHKAEYGANSQN
ncbi:protein kinase domain protein [Aspergillus nomiae NRRL 13137]|uniref:Protein kinase domain protein n=1 Tax=Aspergillus nomiae NRRL (strain ATCC 15546 / NRRL 13137 / CBS 260.88 / M93) TaxID=1509407 RepID=A0A0L1J7R9_ASPN3|nr:protein kinase domain protein [Aspergillus nomiae NRRL 13137]KNG87423.1 protein kinase domain protein [Aspergillus nomiae NRRL 13137]